MTKKGAESERESGGGMDDMVFQNTAKSKKALVHSLSDKEPATQDNEKEKPTPKLVTTNEELIYQIKEK